MLTTTVIENHLVLEPVTADTFIADLDSRSSDTNAVGLATLGEHAAASPRRRIYD